MTPPFTFSETTTTRKGHEMAIADYAHWNEEAGQVWWQEEGRWAHEMNDEMPDEDYEGDYDEGDDEEGESCS